MTDEHKQAKINRIGGSEIGIIMGVNPYQTPVELYFSKIEKLEIKDNQHMKMGRRTEPIIADTFAEETNSTIIKPPKDYYIDGIFIASPDRFYHNGSDKIYILECKNTTKKIEDDAEYSHYLQLQWYLGIIGYESGAVAYLINGYDFKYFSYNREEKIIAEMRQKATDFWNNHIIPRIPPEPVNANDIIQLYPKALLGKTIETDIDGFDIWNQLCMVHSNVSEYNKQEDELKEKLKLKMRDSEGKFDTETLLYADRILATWKSGKNKMIFDEDKFKMEKPELYEQYLIEKKSERRFLPKYPKG